MDDEINSRFIFFSPWTFLFFLLLIIIGNLFIVDFAFFSIKDKKIVLKSTTIATPTQSPSASTTSQNDVCGKSCKDEIARQAALATTVKTPLQKVPVQTESFAKEYFIPLGSGSDTSSDWTDISGSVGYIDSTAYGKIKTVTFEAQLYTPTGNQTAYARLYNVTDAHPVWNSDVSIEGGTAQLRISTPITLDLGSKLYQVQMKTQLQSRTNLESARIHITTY